MANKNNKYFRQCVTSQFSMKSMKNITQNSLDKGKQANISPLISLRLNKSIFAKSKFFKNNSTSHLDHKPSNWSYVQASKINIRNTFPKLSL